jgi:hypothetical protein
LGLRLSDCFLAPLRYPHITWTSCTAHCCDLALEDICKIDFFKDLVKETKDVVQFITNHHATNAIFRALADKMLLKPGY